MNSKEIKYFCSAVIESKLMIISISPSVVYLIANSEMAYKANLNLGKSPANLSGSPLFASSLRVVLALRHFTERLSTHYIISSLNKKFSSIHF